MNLLLLKSTLQMVTMQFEIKHTAGFSRVGIAMPTLQATNCSQKNLYAIAMSPSGINTLQTVKMTFFL